MPRPATLSVWVTGGWRTISLRAHSGFCKCKQVILSRPAGCSARLSVNRRKIMFIRARNRCIPLMDSTPPATNSFSATSLVLPLFLSPPALPPSALSPETGRSRQSDETETLCWSHLTDPCRDGREPMAGPRRITLYQRAFFPIMRQELRNEMEKTGGGRGWWREPRKRKGDQVEVGGGTTTMSVFERASRCLRDVFNWACAGPKWVFGEGKIKEPVIPPLYRSLCLAHSLLPSPSSSPSLSPRALQPPLIPLLLGPSNEMWSVSYWCLGPGKLY